MLPSIHQSYLQYINLIWYHNYVLHLANGHTVVPLGCAVLGCTAEPTPGARRGGKHVALPHEVRMPDCGPTPGFLFHPPLLTLHQPTGATLTLRLITVGNSLLLLFA